MKITITESEVAKNYFNMVIESKHGGQNSHGEAWEILAMVADMLYKNNLLIVPRLHEETPRVEEILSQ